MNSTAVTTATHRTKVAIAKTVVSAPETLDDMWKHTTLNDTNSTAAKPERRKSKPHHPSPPIRVPPSGFCSYPLPARWYPSAVVTISSTSPRYAMLKMTLKECQRACRLAISAGRISGTMSVAMFSVLLHQSATAHCNLRARSTPFDYVRGEHFHRQDSP